MCVKHKKQSIVTTPEYQLIMEDDNHILMQKEIDNTVEVLKSGGSILYPTDTIWGIGCDATNAKAVEKVYKIKRRSETRSLIVLVEKVEDISAYVDQVPEIVFDIMDGIKDPLTIIYQKGKNLAKAVLASDGSVAIRVVKDEFCKGVIHKLGRPITSSSANISGEPSPLCFNRVSDSILKSVDYVVNLRQKGFGSVKQSTMIRIAPNGEIQVVRS